MSTVYLKVMFFQRFLNLMYENLLNGFTNPSENTLWAPL